MAKKMTRTIMNKMKMKMKMKEGVSTGDSPDVMVSPLNKSSMEAEKMKTMMSMMKGTST